MKKRLFSVVLTVLSVLSVLAFSAACGENGATYNNIVAQSNPYSMGTQSIEITATSEKDGEPSAKFKQSISVNDVEGGGALDGKTVTNVVFNSETSVTVTLDGNTKAEGGDGVYGTITVKQSGMASKGNSTCTVNLQIPEIAVRNYFFGGGTKYLVMAELWLEAGGFTENATAENVTLADGETGAISVTLSEGVLKIEVTDCNVKTPSVILNAKVTTFNKEYTVKLAPGSSTRI